MRLPKIKFKIFLTYMATYFLPLLLLGIVGGYWIVNIARDNIYFSHATMLDNIATELDQDVLDIDDFADHITEDHLIRKLLFNNRPYIDYMRTSIFDIEQFSKSLILNCEVSKLYDHIAICFPDKNFVVSSRGTNRYDWFIEDEFSTNQLTRDDWDNLFVDTRDRGKFIINTNMNTYGQNRNGVLWIKTIHGYPLDTAPKYMVALFIDQSTIGKYLDPIKVYPGTITAVFDKDSEYITSHPKTANKELIELIDRYEEDKFIRYNNLEYMKLTTYREDSGWTYVALLPKGEIFKEISQIRISIILILLFSLIPGGIIAYGLALHNYKPLSRIIKIAGFPSDRHVNNIEHVENMLHTVVEQGKQLSKTIDSNFHSLHHAMLSICISGSINIDRKMQLMLFPLLKITLPHSFFSVGVVYSPPVSFLKDISVHLDESNIFSYHTNIEDKIILLFNHPKRDSLKKVLNELSMDYPIAIGTERKDLNKIHESYKEALYLIGYRQIQQPHCITFYDDVIDDLTSFYYYYPIEIEKKIINALRVRDFEVATKFFHQALEINLEGKPSLNAIQSFFKDVYLTTHKVDRELAIDRTFDIDSIKTTDDIDQIRDNIHIVFSDICSNPIPNKEPELISEIIGYIEENITNSQLSLASIAAHFDLSTSTLSTFFKEAYGMNYLEYVNRSRIVLAKQYMVKSSLSINKIAQDVGYNNDVTFRRLFKQYEGVTPTEFKAQVLSNAK